MVWKHLTITNPGRTWGTTLTEREEADEIRFSLTAAFFFSFLLNIFQFAMGRNRAQEKKRQPYWADEAYVGAQSFRHCGNLNSKIPGRSLLFFFSKNPLDLEACFLELPSRQNLMRSSFGLQLSGAAPSGTFLAFEPKFCSSYAQPRQWLSTLGS